MFAVEVIAPVAVINPLVIKLPPATLPNTLKALSVPTLVILGCAFAVTVPAVVALVAVPADVAKVALATVPVTLAPVIALSPDPLPLMLAPLMLPVALTLPAVLILPPLTLPVTARAVSVPTDVIFVCAAVVNVPAILVPDKLPPAMLPVVIMLDVFVPLAK